MKLPNYKSLFMSTLDLNKPSTRQVQEIIKQKLGVTIKLATGDTLVGKLSWQDPDYICLVDNGQQKIIISRLAIAYIQPSPT